MICKKVLPKHSYFDGNIPLEIVKYLVYAVNADIFEELANVRLMAARKYLLHIDLPR